MKIEIGRHEDKPVYFDRAKADNGHIVLLGATGSGKTTQLVKLMNEMSTQGITILAFDTNNIFADNQIHPEYLEVFKANLNVVDVYTEGINMPIFTPITFSDGEKEKDVDVVDSITEAMTKTFKFGVRQRATLRAAVAKVHEKSLYDNLGIEAISQVLRMMETAKAFEVEERISQITGHNVFRNGEFFIQEGKINLLRISKFSEDTQRVIMEIISSFLWKYASKQKFIDKGIYLVFDECQNMDLGKNGMVGKLLIEGRSFNMNLLLSTQVLSQAGNITKQMTQASLMLNFKPAKSEVRAVANLIEPGDENGWILELIQLDRGEFIASGQMVYKDMMVTTPLIVSAKIDN
ncbi:MAG: ATP-binding protein [Anaerovoracaceae bacterium]